MSYKAGADLPVFFRAHNSTAQNNMTVGTEFNVSETYGCIPHSSGGVKASKSYVYGDVRTAGASTDSKQIINVAFRLTSSMLADGWPVANNLAGRVMSDDAIYGVVSTRASMYLKSAESDPGDSDAEETRIFGIRLVP